MFNISQPVSPFHAAFHTDFSYSFFRAIFPPYRFKKTSTKKINGLSRFMKLVAGDRVRMEMFGFGIQGSFHFTKTPVLLDLF